jgi:DHA2 family multidrug resistance protein-like MFS transporter
VTQSTQNELTKSFSSAADLASQHPHYASAIISGAKTSFLQGDQWAYTAGIIAVIVGAAIVFFGFPQRDEEKELLASYEVEDSVPTATAPRAPRPAPARA